MSGALFNTEQVAQRLHLNVQTVRRLANRGELTGVIIGEEWRFEESDIEAYIQRGREKAVEVVRKAKARKTS